MKVTLHQKNLKKDINPQGDLQGALVNSESNATGDKEVEKSGSLPEKLKEDINAQVEHKSENVNSESNSPPEKLEKDINPQGDPQGALVNSESNTTGDKEVEKSGSLPEKLKRRH